VRRLYVYRTKLDALKDMGLRIAPHSRADFDRALDLQSEHGLLTTDSVILATALRLGADHLVTTDRTFGAVSDIDVLVIDDIPAEVP
jgi:predicted nucleic acid-binding protein